MNTNGPMRDVWYLYYHSAPLSFMLSILLFCLILNGCATPKPIGQAITDIDKGYTQNSKLMNQYKQLAENINKRYEYWGLYIGQRHLLNISLRTMLSDVKDDEVETTIKLLGADLENEIYTSELIKLVNELRVGNLKKEIIKVPVEDTGSADTKDIVVFEAGNQDNDTNKIIARMPDIVAACTRQAPKTFNIKKWDISAFDNYHKDVAYLQNINKHIKNYLDIDVTVKAEDIDEISEAIRQLQQ
jgi:hypothetical protein